MANIFNMVAEEAARQAAVKAAADAAAARFAPSATVSDTPISLYALQHPGAPTPVRAPAPVFRATAPVQSASALPFGLTPLTAALAVVAIGVGGFAAYKYFS